MFLLSIIVCSCVCEPSYIKMLYTILIELLLLINNNTRTMTRMSRKLRSDRLHCTFSAIMDIFAMQYLREPNAYEINDLINILGDKGMIWMA